MIRKLTYTVFLALLPFLTYAKLQVCTTTSLIADLVNRIATEDIEIYSIMGAGVDPHLYKATFSDLKALRRADIVFYNGLHLEGRMTDVLEDLGKRNGNVFAVSDGLDSAGIISVSEDEKDPHIWFDPMVWKQALEFVGKKLIEAAPEQEKVLKQNLQRAVSEFDILNAWAKAKAEELPREKRILITSHDAYNYFGKAFGFKVVGVQGISTASEAGLADVVNMVDFIKANTVKSIFVESSVPQATINRISEDAGVAIGGELFSDALGAPGEMLEGEDVGTYTGMFRYNMNTIVGGLK